MKIKGSEKFDKLKSYPFDEVNKVILKLRSEGIEPLDFGEGDPSSPTPKFVREAVKKAIDIHAATGYPSHIGQLEYREAIAKWMKKKFGVILDPKTEISSTLGSKEAIAGFPQTFVNHNDIVILPTPGYPVMKSGTIFSGGIPYFIALREENNYLLDYKSIPEDIAKRAKIIWINYPNSPTGACATREYYQGLIKWAEKYNIIIAADEGCYIDIYFGKKPMSILELGKRGIVTFYSMSKRNNMTGYRVGWLAGDREIIEKFKMIKSNIDSGTPNFIQAGAIAALEDEKHAKQMREEYRKKREIMFDAFKKAKIDYYKGEGAYYLWVKAPHGINGVEFAKKLLSKELAIVVTPGAWISDTDGNGYNPGENFVRFALVPPMKDVKEAARRIKKFY